MAVNGNYREERRYQRNAAHAAALCLEAVGAPIGLDFGARAPAWRLVAPGGEGNIPTL